MGCEVVSVYNDEVIGKIGFSQGIIEDLIDRDCRQPKPLLKHKQTTAKIKQIYGFTQSFTISKLFFTTIKTQQSLVYVAGRFIVIEQVKSKSQRIITNPQVVASFSIMDKLCLVGLIGGTLLLWDLEFLEVKLDILLPEASINISSVGLTSKYVFATDGSTPNNLAYCYDLRTAQLLSCKPIPSIEPVIKSINPTEDLHVTVCADGIWIIKMHRSSKEIEVIKGMFGTYPKTSMTCLGKVGEYIISGGVDGYVYVWRIRTRKCCRAMKVSDTEIISIGVKGKHIIFGSLNGRVKVFTFQVKKKEKKEYIIEQLRDEDDDEEVVFIVVDSYLKEGSTIAICASVQDPYLYYCLTKEGVLYQKYLPAPTSERKKVSLLSNFNENIKKINTTGTLSLIESKLYSVYMISKVVLMVDIYSCSESVLKLEEERSAILKEDCQNILSYSEQTQEIAYLTTSNKVQVSSTFNKVGEAVSQENKSDIGSDIQSLIDLNNEKLISMNFASALQNQYLCLTSNESIRIYHRMAKLAYEEKTHLKYENTIPSSITVDEQEFNFDKQCQKWMEKKNRTKSLAEEEIEEKSVIHGSRVKSVEEVWKREKMSCGGGFIIVWK